MSDHTSAEIFGDIFKRLAAPDECEAPCCFSQRLLLARWLWRQTQCYDFRPVQMGCADALVTLGLARKLPDDDYDWGPQ